MPHYIFHLFAFSLACAIVLIATPIVRQIGLTRGLVDQPGARKVHEQPMVRLGGVSIFIGTTLALLTVWRMGGFIDAQGGLLSPQADYEIWGVTIGGLLFFCIGLADDLFNLSAIVRLLLQTTVASLVWSVAEVQVNVLSVPFGDMIELNEPVSWIVTILWLVGMTNAINWIDGLDGLAAGVAGIAATIMLFVCLFADRPAAALIAAALAGGTLGFLRYNFNPAQIFMGDGGSYYLGFTLAAVGIVGLIKSSTVTAVLLPYVILAVPIVDMSAVIIDRLRSGNSPFIADKRHLHHRLLSAGLSHRSTVLLIYCLTLWVGSLAIAFAGVPSGLAYVAGTTALLIYTGFLCWRQREN